MKKIIMSLLSVAVFALAACAPAANTNNPLASLVSGTGAGAGTGLGVGGRLTKAQVIKWADCVLSKAGPEAKVSIEQVKTLWSQIPDAAFETAITPEQVQGIAKAYAQVGCTF